MPSLWSEQRSAQRQQNILLNLSPLFEGPVLGAARVVAVLLLLMMMLLAGAVAALLTLVVFVLRRRARQMASLPPVEPIGLHPLWGHMSELSAGATAWRLCVFCESVRFSHPTGH